MVKTQFSIKDLENLSGIKAHTLRIWEKRYNLLTPSRSDTNIRRYDLDNLKKLLNVTLLYNHGHKISKIASLDQDGVRQLITQTVSSRDSEAINAFKSAMFDFDARLFTNTYNGLREAKDFRTIFFEIFLPLLDDIGLLWQTGTIDPTHERFISELIRQKIMLHIEEKQRRKPSHDEPVFVLFLPYGEIHDIGLMYAYYEIIAHDFPAVYLGSNIPSESLVHVLKHHSNVVFVTYLTVKPDGQEPRTFVSEMRKALARKEPHDIWLMGYQARELDQATMPESIKIFESMEHLVTTLENLKKS